MTRLALLAVGLLVSAAARAEEPSPEFLGAALQAMQVQRDQALNQAVMANAQLALAKAEAARLRRELDLAKAGPTPSPETK
ncbi:hypothetical protein [Methylobacterium frigidaeris]|uniref:Transporter n=1 Tax=Methylobacterium frigidaeris TaxID=2038277 RepID=A0AA37HD29_9HYPH|nr:hypothetical protein [Methylobacterium frigidaeris]GJD63736.1 hypothetical protein MPEAHAMD_3907 [Methylobacterium frigidaeris]